MITVLPPELASVPNDGLAPLDRWMILHRSDTATRTKNFYRKANCGTAVAPVRLSAVTEYGRGVCVVCYPHHYGPKGQ